MGSNRKLSTAEVSAAVERAFARQEGRNKSRYERTILSLASSRLLTPCEPSAGSLTARRSSITCDRSSAATSCYRKVPTSHCRYGCCTPPTSSAPAPAWTIFAKAALNSPAALTNRICRPMARPAASTSLSAISVSGVSGFSNAAMTAALGTSSWSSRAAWPPNQSW